MIEHIEWKIEMIFLTTCDSSALHLDIYEPVAHDVKGAYIQPVEHAEDGLKLLVRRVTALKGGDPRAAEGSPVLPIIEAVPGGLRASSPLGPGAF